MKIITKLSYSDKLRFPDRVLQSNNKLVLIAKNEYEEYSFDSNDNLKKELSVNFPAFEEIFLSKFNFDNKQIFVTKTDKHVHVYYYNEYAYLEEINKIKLDEENITVFASDDQAYIVIYNVQELLIYRTNELLQDSIKPYKSIEVGEKCAILQIQITQGFIYGLLNIEKSPYLGRINLLQGDITHDAFELKLLNYKANEIAVCGERLCVYADDESYDLYIYKIDELFNGKTSIDTEYFRDKKIYVSQAVKLFAFNDNTIGVIQANNNITLVDTSKYKRVHRAELNNIPNFNISETVDAVRIDDNKLLLKTLNELLMYYIDTGKIKLVAKFKEVFEEVIDLSV